jgi:pilus assembly protein CpaE
VDNIRTLVALDRGVPRDVVDTALPPTSDIHVVGVVDGLSEGWRVLQETSPDLLVIICAGESDHALLLVDRATKERPSRPVVVLAEGAQNGYVRRVFEAGADDIVTLPESPDRIQFALTKAVARKQQASAEAGGAAPLVGVLGPKGGTGKTLTACNLAAALAKAGQRVLVIDLDLQFGDVGLALGLRPERTIADLAKAGGSLDAEKVAAYTIEHESSGVLTLLAPTRPDQAAYVTVDFLKALYAAVRSAYDFVIVDTPPGFTPEVIASIDSSSEILMVAMLDALSLKNTKLGLETLDLMGYDADKILVVLNRADSRVGIDGEDVAAVLGRQPDVLVPSDREVTRTVNEATPIVIAKERSDAAKAFRGLAERMVERQAAKAAALAGSAGSPPGPAAPAAPQSNGGGRKLLTLGRRA